MNYFLFSYIGLWPCCLLLTAFLAGIVVTESMPEIGDMDTIGGSSSFTCQGKVVGGYYADVDSGCQMFHVCTLGIEGNHLQGRLLVMKNIKSPNPDSG